MTVKGLAGAVLSVSLLIAAIPAFAEDTRTLPLTVGVYECYDQMANPTPEMMFGLLDEARYSNYDGKIGTYSYDVASGVIEVGLETGAPARFSRIAATTFRAINDDGSLAGFVCPLNRSKDPSNPPW